MHKTYKKKSLKHYFGPIEIKQSHIHNTDFSQNQSNKGRDELSSERGFCLSQGTETSVVPVFSRYEKPSMTIL